MITIRELHRHRSSDEWGVSFLEITSGKRDDSDLAYRIKRRMDVDVFVGRDLLVVEILNLANASPSV